jgi:hypothetical protein
VLLVALQLRLGRQVIHLGPHESLLPAQDVFDLPASFCLFISSICSARKEQIVYHFRPFQLSGEVASRVFGQGGVQLVPYFNELALDVELLKLRPQAGAG